MEVLVLENEIEIPDFVASFSGKGFETKPGIQFAGAIKSNRLQRGERTYLLFVLQNALDATIEGEIKVVLPSTKMFKSTNLSTVSPVPFTLKGMEVEKIEIPIQTSPNTPEGQYEVQITIKGKGGEGGNRVRGKKEGKQWGKAAAKSVASSVALSAVGLLFGGVGVRVYAPSDNLKTSFVVRDPAVAVTDSPLQVMREKLWDEKYAKIYVSLSGWISKCLADWRSNEKLKNQVATFFIPKLCKLFETKQIEMSEEELLWLGRLLAFATFNLGLVSIQNLTTIPMKQANALYEGKEVPETPVWQDVLDFEKDIMQPWLSGMTDNQFYKRLAIIGAIYMAVKMGKQSDHGFIRSLADDGYSKFADEHYEPRKLMKLFHFFFVLAVSLSKSLFPEEERITHLRLLSIKVNGNLFMKEEDRQRLVEMIDQQIAVKS